MAMPPAEPQETAELVTSGRTIIKHEASDDGSDVWLYPKAQVAWRLGGLRSVVLYLARQTVVEEASVTREMSPCGRVW